MIHTFLNTRGLLTPLRRPANPEYLSVLDCGRVPINNLDPVIRVSNCSLYANGFNLPPIKPEGLNVCGQDLVEYNIIPFSR